MKKHNLMRCLMAGAAMLLMPAAASATDLEVTHWWTSGGESAAARELAKAFEQKTGNKWVDGAIGGSTNVARPIIISRILGGDPMGATQMNHGKQAEELIEAGLLLDITDIAEEGKWREVIKPISLLDACTINGRVYCVPLNIHSPQWLWTSPAAFQAADVQPATNWEELKAAAPKLREAGKLPLAVGSQGWQQVYILNTLVTAEGGPELFYKVYRDKDKDALSGDAMSKVFAELAIARDVSKGTNTQDWNLATAKVINGDAGAQVMGDWAQGEFAVAGKIPDKDYGCFIGLGGPKLVSTGGDAMYFPVNKSTDVTTAQKELAKVLIAPDTQVAFNLKKGSLPVRGDVDMATASDCMKKGLETLNAGNTIPSPDQLISPDAVGQMGDLMAEFFGSNMSSEDAQKRFATIIAGDA